MVLKSVRLFGKDGLFDLHLQDGRIARIVPAITQGEGLLALPGFCESHAHLFGGGVTLAQLNLSQVHDAAALRVALLRHAAATPEGDMVCAYGANYDLLGENRPDRHALDAVLADRPLCITSTDFHCAWANTAALQAAGILHGADAGAGAEVVMGPDGLATGELREFAAMALVRHLAPSGGREGLGLTAQEPQAITPAQRANDKATLLRAMQECLRHGITSVVNMDGNLYQADLLKELAQDGLPLNVSLPMTLVPGQSAARAKNGPRDARHRIEHIDMIHPTDLPRLAALGVVASMQPVHPPGLAGLPLEPTVSIMGQARWKDTFPWRAIKDQGVALAFGTDWPVSPLSPLYALHCALSRKPWGQGQPDQRLTLGEALNAYTHAGSYALFTENLRGQIAVGMRADVVLLRGDVQGLAQRPDAVEIVGVYVDGEQA